MLTEAARCTLRVHSLVESAKTARRALRAHSPAERDVKIPAPNAALIPRKGVRYACCSSPSLPRRSISTAAITPKNRHTKP